MMNKPTVILRHRKENLAKCSLRGLEAREDLLFFTYPKHPLPKMENYIMLSMEGEELSEKDRDFGLFLIDGTWNYADVMVRYATKDQTFIHRTLPKTLLTAYPRKQTGCADPDRGLATVEALFAAYVIMGKEPKGLLDHYHWKDLFLSQNGLNLLI